MKFYLNNTFRIRKPSEVPISFIQYSTETVELFIPFGALNNVVVCNVVRPDGFKTNEMFLDYVGPVAGEPGIHKWTTTITPYHTNNIPGTKDNGIMILNFMLRQFENNVLVGIQSSPLFRISVARSIEPAPESLPYSVQDAIFQDLQELQVEITDHDQLSTISRNKPNQHTIDAISGLRRKVEVHVGESEPIEEAETWLDVAAVDQEVVVTGNWTLLSSTPNIFLGAYFSTNIYTIGEPMRLVAIGNLAGEVYRQELHSDINGIISGEILISLSEDYINMASVHVTLVPDGTNHFTVTGFQNTGNILINDFTALSIEVHR